MGVENGSSRREFDCEHAEEEKRSCDQQQCNAKNNVEETLSHKLSFGVKYYSKRRTLAMVSAISKDLMWTDYDADALKNYQKIAKVQTEWQILVNLTTNHLHLLQNQKPITSYVVSTAKNGPGQEENTGKTPLGLHQIKEKIGEGADPYAIFKSRIDTKEKAIPNDGTAAIVGRILWLEGLEEGVNKGKNKDGVVVDTHDRYIYIHGTNAEKELGQATSGGCVRMAPKDIIALFNEVCEGTHVYLHT
jgi:hypothetical protein